MLKKISQNEADHDHQREHRDEPVRRHRECAASFA
jgi:hypothetical protein